MNTIPECATLKKDEAGVRWYSRGEGNSMVHFMQFDGVVLAGGWTMPRFVFQALVEMTPEERTGYASRDELMGAIRMRILHR